MFKKAGIALALMALVAIWAVTSYAQEAKEAKATKEAYSYIGMKKCSMCHKKDATGNQLAVWSATAHAKAFEVLSSEAGLAKAKELKVADPCKDAACLKCHTTGHGTPAALGGDALLPADGVSCEACHGPGSGYNKMKTMQDIHAGTLDGTTVGLHKVDESTCLGCHKKDNPGHKGTFDYATAIKKIAHPIPAPTKG